VLGDLAQDTDGQAGTWKRMPLQQLVRDTQFRPDSSYFVFEQKTERLYQLEMHGRRQTADIVMRFDGHTRTMYTNTFDNVGIDRTLSQQFHTAHFFGFLLEDLKKSPADGLTFGLGIGLSRQLAIEKLFGVDPRYIQADLFISL